MLNLGPASLKQMKVSSKFGWVFQDFQSTQIQYNKRSIVPVPEVAFRLSANIKDFIGRTGLNGLVPAVLTSCSLALKKNEDYVRTYLELFFTEEQQQIKDDKPSPTHTKAAKENTKDVLKRCFAFMDPTRDQFNERAYELIESAGKESNLAKMDIQAEAWF